ncbi:MAG TPA: hypothetical protein VKU41_13830 [Polyangiaceae bacterium]|nr:hypothetical protein [Polyangiaceae bacterium]
MTFGKRATGTAKRPGRPAGGASLVVRALILGSIGIAGATWALVRHYTRTPAPMLVPVPSAAPTYDADAGEMPVPEVLGPGR